MNTSQYVFYDFVGKGKRQLPEKVDAFLSQHPGYRREEKKLPASDAVAGVFAGDDLCGVSLAQKIIVPHFNNNYFFEFQQFLTRDHAEQDSSLASRSFALLDEIAANPGPAKPIGIFFVFNDGRRRRTPFWKRAVVSELGLVLAGFTRADDPIYVHYFRGARIQ